MGWGWGDREEAGIPARGAASLGLFMPGTLYSVHLITCFRPESVTPEEKVMS